MLGAQGSSTPFRYMLSLGYMMMPSYIAINYPINAVTSFLTNSGYTIAVFFPYQLDASQEEIDAI